MRSLGGGRRHWSLALVTPARNWQLIGAPRRCRSLTLRVLGAAAGNRAAHPSLGPRRCGRCTGVKSCEQMRRNPPAAGGLAAVGSAPLPQRPQREPTQQPPAGARGDQRPPAAAPVAALSLRFSDPDAEAAFSDQIANANRRSDLFFLLFGNMVCLSEWAGQCEVGCLAAGVVEGCQCIQMVEKGGCAVAPGRQRGLLTVTLTGSTACLPSCRYVCGAGQGAGESPGPGCHHRPRGNKHPPPGHVGLQPPRAAAADSHALAGS